MIAVLLIWNYEYNRMNYYNNKPLSVIIVECQHALGNLAFPAAYAVTLTRWGFSAHVKNAKLPRACNICTTVIMVAGIS